MENFLAQNPALQGMVTFERAIHSNLVPMLSLLSTEQSWQQLRARLAFSANELPKPSWATLCNEWLGFTRFRQARGWPLRFALAVVCVMQTGLLVYVAQTNNDALWNETRSINVPTLATLATTRYRALPHNTVSQLLAALRSADVQRVTGPNAEGELRLATLAPATTVNTIQKLVASGLLVYVSALPTQVARR